MGYLPGFSADIFISYSHIDDYPFGEKETRWVTYFHSNLYNLVRSYLGRPITIWRDPKLGGTDIFSEEIASQLGRSAALVSIVSPGYIESEWCRRELQLFTEATRQTGGIRIGNKTRIVKVLKTPVARERLPELLDAILGYEFYRVDLHTEVVREFLIDPNVEARSAYWARLDDVAQEVKRLFDLMLAGRDSQSSSAGSIYLALTSSDRQNQRDALRRELEDRGYQILPDKPLPWNAEQIVEAVGADLERSAMSIHLLGERYGLVPDGETRSIVELQLELAANRAGSKRVVWIPPGTAPAEDRQRSFIDQVRNQPGPAGAVELLEASLEEVKSFVIDRLRKGASAEPAVRKAASNGAESDLCIYLVCDQRDRPAVVTLCEHLIEQGFEVMLPLRRGDPEQVRNDHQENLLICDAALIYWGAADEFWLRTKMRDLIRARGLGRDKLLRGSAIYVAEPQDEAKQEFVTGDGQVIRERGEFSPVALEPFIAWIKRATGV
jgi:hypothetical protein